MRATRLFLAVFITSLLGAAVAFAKGGEFGGGGNLDPMATPSDAQITKYLTEIAPKYAKFFFNQINPGPDDIIRALQFTKAGSATVLSDQFFRTSPSIFDAISKARIQIENNGPCLDPLREERDGSARVDASGAMIVCYSLPRLREQLHIYDFEKRLLALSVHEYSHLVGSDETQAKDLEHYVLNEVAADYSSDMSIALTTVQINNISASIKERLVRYNERQSHSSVSRDAICADLLVQFKRFQQLKDMPWMIEQMGLSVQSYEQKLQANLASAKWLYLLESSCMQSAKFREAAQLDYDKQIPLAPLNIFKGNEKQISISEFTKRGGDQFRALSPFGSGFIRRLGGPDDSANFTSELAEIRALVEQSYPEFAAPKFVLR